MVGNSEAIVDFRAALGRRNLLVCIGSVGILFLLVLVVACGNLPETVRADEQN